MAFIVKSGALQGGDEGPLPEGWFEAKDPHGKKYYYTAEGKTQWERPKPPKVKKFHNVTFIADAIQSNGIIDAEKEIKDMLLAEVETMPMGKYSSLLKAQERLSRRTDIQPLDTRFVHRLRPRRVEPARIEARVKNFYTGLQEIINKYDPNPNKYDPSVIESVNKQKEHSFSEIPAKRRRFNEKQYTPIEEGRADITKKISNDNIGFRMLKTMTFFVPLFSQYMGWQGYNGRGPAGEKSELVEPINVHSTGKSAGVTSGLVAGESNDIYAAFRKQGYKRHGWKDKSRNRSSHTHA